MLYLQNTPNSTWVKSDGSNPQAEIFLFMKTENETGYFTYVDRKVIATSTNWVKIEKTFSQNFNRYGYVLNNPLKYTDFSGEKWNITWNDVLAAVQIIGGVALTVFSAGTLAYVGGGLIVAGVSHFAATYNEYKQTGDWASASNNQGVLFVNLSFDTDFGYGKDKQNGVSFDEPVVNPKSDVDGGGNFTNEITAGQLGGGLLINSFLDKSGKYLDKAHYLQGTWHPSNSINFNS